MTRILSFSIFFFSAGLALAQSVTTTSVTIMDCIPGFCGIVAHVQAPVGYRLNLKAGGIVGTTATSTAALTPFAVTVAGLSDQSTTYSTVLLLARVGKAPLKIDLGPRVTHDALCAWDPTLSDGDATDFRTLLAASLTSSSITLAKQKSITANFIQGLTGFQSGKNAARAAAQKAAIDAALAASGIVQ